MSDETERYELSNRDKGRRNENEARRILSAVYRKPIRVDAYAETDPWHLVDIIALDPEIGIRFVQVKTNRFTARARRKYTRMYDAYVPPEIPFEVWVRVDREGWQMHAFDPDEETFTNYLRMDTCDEYKTRDTYRAQFGLEPLYENRYEAIDRDDYHALEDFEHD